MDIKEMEKTEEFSSILMAFRNLEHQMGRGDGQLYKGNSSGITAKGLEGAALTGGSFETVQRYGSAAKEHYVAYSGVDYEHSDPHTGQPHVLKKSLKSIKNQRENAEYEYQIRRQKEGWAAEVKDTAETNAENIINGKSTRKIRYDDVPGNSANNQLYDHVEIDSRGNVIEGSGSQMKFIGAQQNDPNGVHNAENTVNKLVNNKKFQKYIDNDVTIEVPKDEYEKCLKAADKELKDAEQQLKRCQAEGKREAAEQQKQKINNIKKLKKNLRPSKVTRKQAEEAVKSPFLSTAKSAANIAHRAGVEQAKNGARIGGGISLIKNFAAVVKGEKSADQAAADVVKDTASGAAMSYATGAAGTLVKGAMQNSSKAIVRNLSKTGLPGQLVSLAVTVGSAMKSYMNGDIDGAECLEQLGQEGFATLGGALGAAAGGALSASLGATGWAVVAGSMGGSMVVYAAASAVYGQLSKALKEAKLAREERIRIEKECAEAVELILKYRQEMNDMVNRYMSRHIETINSAFKQMDKAILEQDTDGYIAGNVRIQKLLNCKPQFENFDDFCSLMESDAAFRL